MIALTGANGYVGGRILARLRAEGMEVVSLVRRPDPADERERSYALGRPIEDGTLDGVESVIHAAYDLSARGEDIRAINLSGSMALLDGVSARSGRVLLISSLSAFEGARSVYGRTKLELEYAVLERGGIVLRPGLIFGARAQGLFGAIVAALSKHSLMPMIGSGSQRLFVTHDERFAELVAAIVSGRVQAGEPMFAAHEVPTTLRGIAAEIAASADRRLITIPLAPALVGLGLRAGEAAGVELPFRSDSLRSLQHPVPLDQVSALARSPIAFPPLSAGLWLS